MPKDNNQTPIKPITNSDDHSPVFMEETLPPMPQNTPTTQNVPPTPDKKDLSPTETPITTSGSAAPQDDSMMPPIINSKNKKKFGGGKMIVTILGLLILVGGLGAGVLLVRQQQDIREKAVTGVCEGPCGQEPTYSFNKVPTTIGPFSQAGTVVLYYISLNGGGRKITLSHNNADYVITPTMTGSNQRERIVTEIQVDAGDTVILKESEDLSSTNKECAPVQGPPFYDWGWIDVNTNQTCGSDLPGPPTQCTPFGVVSVAEHITWAEGFDQPIISKQCWGDWREWIGDYDFDDYLLMIGLETEDVVTPTPTTTATSTSTATATATATSTSTGSGTATATATSTSTGSGRATATATSTASGEPNSCNGTCGSNNNCGSGLFCYSGFCRNSSCPTDTDCVCSGTATPTSTSQPSLPEAGTSWPTILGTGFGILIILGSLLLVL